MVLLTGAKENPTSGKLLYELSRFTGQHIGTSNDSLSWRRFFSDDTELLSCLLVGMRREDVLGPYGKPDNWLVARQLALRAEPMLAVEAAKDPEGVSPLTVSPLIFYSSAAMNQIKYAIALEEEGIFGEVAGRAWKDAAQQWHAYGDREIRETLRGTHTLRLNDFDRLAVESQRLREELHSLAPGVRARISDERRKGLPENLRKALDIDPLRRSPKQWELAERAEAALVVTNQDVAKRVEGANREKALAIADAADAAESAMRLARQCRLIVNYDCWQCRCRAEQLPSTLKGRRLLFEARRELRKISSLSPDVSVPDDVKRAYEQGFSAWHETLAACPALEQDEGIREELLSAAGVYRRHLLDGAPLPEGFPLREAIDRWSRLGGERGQ